MKPIIISETNRAKIEECIKAEEGRATERRITFDDIVKATKEIEKTLGIPKKYLEGVRYDVDMNAQNFPKAYKYRAESTHFIVLFERGKWRVTCICRLECRAAYKRFLCFRMPEEAQRAYIGKAQVF